MRVLSFIQSSPVGNIAARTKMAYISIQSGIGRERVFGNEDRAASFASHRDGGNKAAYQSLFKDGSRFHISHPPLKSKREEGTSSIKETATL